MNNIIETDYVKYVHDEIANLLDAASRNNGVCRNCADAIALMRSWYLAAVPEDPSTPLPESKVLDAFDEVSDSLYGGHHMSCLNSFDTWLSNRKHHMKLRIMLASRAIANKGSVPMYDTFVHIVLAPDYKIGPGEYGLVKRLYFASGKLLDMAACLNSMSEDWEDILTDSLGVDPMIYSKDKLDNL